MTCNGTGPFDPVFGSKWGIVDYDWSANTLQYIPVLVYSVQGPSSLSSRRSNWKSGSDGWSTTVPMDCEEKLARQAAMTKAVNNHTKVFVCECCISMLGDGQSGR